MGMYAQLLNGLIECPKCGLSQTHTWQFYFGDVQDLPEYRIGDTVTWASDRCFGHASMVEIYAIAYHARESFCPGCIQAVLGLISIHNSKITGIEFLEVGTHRKEILLLGETREPYFQATVASRNRID